MPICWPEILLIMIATLLLLVGYHILLIRRIRRAPLTTAVGLTNQLRQQWTRIVMQERRDVLAVQALRNWVMASTFLASTAILIALGILNAATRPSDFAQISHALNLVGTHNCALWMVKMMVLAIDFFLAFFNFTLAIRYFNHAGYGVGMPDQSNGPATHEFIAGIINQASPALYCWHALLLPGHPTGAVDLRPHMDARRDRHAGLGVVPA
jgi:uncharacterized membrane protein